MKKGFLDEIYVNIRCISPEIKKEFVGLLSGFIIYWTVQNTLWITMNSKKPILEGMGKEWIILLNPSPKYTALHRLHLKTSSGWNS
ncbi:hypothetical protein QFZ73_001079 [Peribacillus sp. V2I11]|nr:hypothetical protein [Peribacillus sp. V2I11]